MRLVATKINLKQTSELHLMRSRVTAIGCLQTSCAVSLICQYFKTTKPQICVLLKFYAAQNGSILSTFRDNLSIPSSRVKKSMKECWEHIGTHFINGMVWAVSGSDKPQVNFRPAVFCTVRSCTLTQGTLLRRSLLPSSSGYKGVYLCTVLP